MSGIPTPFERAGAKVTLSLRVLGRRADGFHELDALVAIVDEPHDVVSLLDGGGDGELLIEPRGAAPDGDENLVWRARAALGSSVALRLRKGIPTESGLGGGSADAAATLRLLRDRGGDGAEAADLSAIAAALGADVPVCMQPGIWRMRGVGDVLEPVEPSSDAVHLVLATPPFGCHTADVYRAWDELGGPTSVRLLAPSAGLAACGGEFDPDTATWMNDAHVWRNDLEPAARHVEPRIKGFAGAFGSIAETLAIMCGSGSTHYVRVPTRDAAERVAAAVRVELDTRCVAVTTIGKSSDR